MEHKLSDYEFEQQLLKFKANTNSKYLNSKGKLEYLEDYEITSLDEYLIKLKNGQIVVDSNEVDLDDFEKTTVVLPEIGEVEVYENSETSEKRKMESAKDEDKSSKSEDLINFSVIPLQDDENGRTELIVDENGFDLGVMTYDENGNPSFQMSEDLKSTINDMLTEVNARSQVDEKTIEDEFYLKDIESFMRAAQEGKLVPKSIEEVGKRAASAQNIKNKHYNEKDAENAVIQTPEEILEEEEEKEAAKSKIGKKDRLSQKENERNITEEKREDEELDKAEPKLQQKGKLDKIDPSQKSKNDEDEKNKNIPENKKDEIKEMCENQNLEEEKITAVLIIKDPSTLADCTEKSHINRKGNEVTVVQFSNITGKERYVMIQDGVELGGEAHDRDFRDLIAPLKRTTGVYKRVEDNENFVDYTNSNGVGETMQIRGVPHDISRTQKEYFRERFEILMDEIEKARKNEPENTVKIDALEQDLYDLCKYFNIVPNPSIKEDAEEVQEPEKTEEYRDEEDEYDPRERRAGDPRGPRY